VEERGLYHGSCALVARPASVEEAAEVVRLCAEGGLPIVPQGGNTGLVGGAVAARGQILVNLSRMNLIRALDPVGRTVSVEAGCILADLQAAAADARCLFPLSLGAEGSCQIGGNLATNAGGVHVLGYGTTRSLTLGLEVVLPDGRVWNGLRTLIKDNSGYDLKHLFIGSEGTLGIITAATLRLFPAPARTVTAMAAARSLTVAGSALAALQQATGNRMVACEVLSARAMEFTLRHLADARPPFAKAVPWAMLTEFHGGDGLRAEVEEGLAALLEGGVLDDAIVADSSAQAAALWRLREGVPSAQGIEGGSIKHDISVPPAQMEAFVDRATRAVEAASPGVRVVAFGHLGDGNLHFNLSQPVHSDRNTFAAEGEKLNQIVHKIAVELGGSISAEHGIGLAKAAELARLYAPVEIDLMRSVKRALDPAGILNPGKILGDDDPTTPPTT
ncbi:MAG: FAD-binding oxidoreductase, partial [Proteobacteria bacterium]|nr:FAD-binding oxidoreductase [Pseudomonadota bacterium]